jgi:hypothetical protein
MQIRGKNHGHLPHLLTVHLFNGNGPRIRGSEVVQSI